MESLRCCSLLRRREKADAQTNPTTQCSPNTSAKFPGRLDVKPATPIIAPSSPVAESSPLTAKPRGTGTLQVQTRPSLSRYHRTSTSDISHFSISHANPEVNFVARDIWITAYASLRAEAEMKPLFDNYESFFNTVLWPGSLGAISNGVRSSNGSGSATPGLVTIEEGVDGEARFRQVAKCYADSARKHAANNGIASAAVQFIMRTKDIVSAALAASPPASLAWAGVCLVLLPVIINHAEQIAARQSGFSYVMSRLPWYGQVIDLLNRDYWKSYHSFNALQESIKEEIVYLYKLLIEYQLRAYYTYCRRFSTISRDVLKLDDWAGMISEIKETETRLQGYIDLNFDQHLLEKLHTISEEAIRKQRNDILHKFKFPEELPYEVYQAYFDSIENPEDDTGRGVLSHPVFLDWASGRSGVFVMTGIPGSGKSVLAKSMLVELPKLRPTTVCSFFFKDNGRGQNLATTALCRILDDLFSQEPTLVDRFSAKIQHLIPQEVRCNLDLLWEILTDATEGSEPGSLTVVLDALDECEPESAIKLCNKLSAYIKGPAPKMKFFLTARPFVSSHQPIDMDQAIMLKTNEDPHCLQYLSKDIEHVLNKRFERFAKRCIPDDLLKQELLRLIQPREERTYLYVKLLFDYLDLKIRDGLPRVPRDWIPRFKALPATVKETYGGFLERVNEAHRNDVRVMLQMVVAAARPLTVREINIALNVRDCYTGNPNGLGLQPELAFRDWILDSCKFFLDVYNNRVYFIHQTAKDYLLAPPRSLCLSKPAWLGNFTIEDCHSTMAETCAAYLSLPFRSRARFRGIGTIPTSLQDERTPSYHLWDFEELEFSNYAAVHWHDHVQQGQVLVHPLWRRTAGCTDECINNIKTLQSWDSFLMTFVRFNVPSKRLNVDHLVQALQPEDSAKPVPGVHLDMGNPGYAEALALSLDPYDELVISDESGKPLSGIQRVSATAADCVKRLATTLRSVALRRTVRGLGNYYAYTPLPMDWFSIHVFSENEDFPEASFCNIQVQEGDTLRYVLSNRLESEPVHVHVLSLNTSWTIGTLMWNARIPPMGERSGEITPMVAHKVNDDDDCAMEEIIIVILCVGEQTVDRFRTAKEWLNRIYLPPVLLAFDRRSQSVPTWLPFVPPPNCQIRHFSVQASPRLDDHN